MCNLTDYICICICNLYVCDIMCIFLLTELMHSNFAFIFYTSKCTPALYLSNNHLTHYQNHDDIKILYMYLHNVHVYLSRRSLHQFQINCTLDLSLNTSTIVDSLFKLIFNFGMSCYSSVQLNSCKAHDSVYLYVMIENSFNSIR